MRSGNASGCSSAARNTLNLHFRSHPSIIGFSNDRIYGSRLEVCTPRPLYLDRPFIEWRTIRGRARRDARGRSWMNAEEARAVVDELAKQHSKTAGLGMSLGVVTPFR